MSRYKIASAAIVVALASFVTVQLAQAQSVEDWRKATETNQPKFELVQSYHGTSPGTGNSLPRVEELKGLDGSWITWPGFLMKKDGSSRIFLQTTEPLEYTQKEKKNKITLRFKGTKVHLSNNQNPLVTFHFNTPLKKAYLKKSRKYSELIMEMKVESEISIMQVTVEDGYNYIFIDFPVGSYPLGGSLGGRQEMDNGTANDAGAAKEQESPYVMDEESPF